MKYLKQYNESIRKYLKPKSEEDIKNALKKLTPNEKILRGCENNYMWLVKMGIDEGGDPSFDGNNCIWLTLMDGDYINIIKLLLDDDRVLTKAVKSGDIDHFIEVVNNELKDPRWVEYISKRIDKLFKSSTLIRL